MTAPATFSMLNLIPVLPDRGPFGLGRARTWDWPPNVIEVTPQQLRSEQVDVLVAQRAPAPGNPLGVMGAGEGGISAAGAADRQG